MKNHPKIVMIFVAGLILFPFISCTVFTGPDTKDNNTETAAAYADTATLSQISAVDGNVNWQVARFFALGSFEEFKQTNDWNGASLSQRPLVIYKANTEDPRFYEFRVIRDNEEIGAIACVIEKQEGDPVQYVMPFAKSITSENGRSLLNKKGKLIDAGYPGTLLLREEGSARSISTETGIEDTAEYPVDVKVLDLLESIEPSMYEEYGITSQEMYDTYVNEQREEEERINNFWQEVTKAEQEILNLSEEKILSMFAADETEGRATKYESSKYILWDWYNKTGWSNPGGWCGPSVASFITLGLGTRSGYAGVPTTNDSSKIRVMYNAFENRIGTGAKVYLQLNAGMKSLTNYSIYADAFHNWDTVNSNIRTNNLPAVSLRSSILTDWSKLAWHYRTIIGTCKEYYKQKYVFLWWSWYDYYDAEWYLMHDNGADDEGARYWEKAGKYYQFHSARVLRYK